MSIRIFYNAYEFTAAGCAQFSRISRMDPSPETGAIPVRELVTWRIKEVFTESTFADNHARFEELRAALATTSGVLRINDESGGTIYNGPVRVSSHDLPEQWGQYSMDATVDFAAPPAELAGNATNASFTPAGGSAVVLPAVEDWKEAVRTERYSTAVPNRRETIVRVTLSGTYVPDPTLEAAQVRALLEAKRAEVKSCAQCPDGTLVFGGINQVVRVEDADADIGDGTSKCAWSITAFYRQFPDGDYAEAEYTLSIKDNMESAERVYTMRGKVRAHTEEAATAKANALRDTMVAGGRLQTVNETEVQRVDGEDGADFIELSFSFEWRQMLDENVSWNLSISTKDELRSDSRTQTWSGTVRASGSAAALAKVEELVEGATGWLMSKTQTLSTRGINDAEQFYEVQFSYEYLSRAGMIFAEISSDAQDESFGENATTISGYVVADSESTAVALARGLKPAGTLLRSSRENKMNYKMGSGLTGGTQFIKVDFSYVFRAERTEGSLRYSVAKVKDYKAGLLTTTVSGTAWAASEAACNTLIDALKTQYGETGKLAHDERRPEFEQRTTLNGFLQVPFTLQFEGALTALDQVLEAEFSLETVGSIDKSVVTPIPFGVPVAQVNCGLTVGTRTVTGFASGTNENAVRSWGQGKRSMVQGSGRYEVAPREKMAYTSHYAAPDAVRIMRFDFTYGCETW